MISQNKTKLIVLFKLLYRNIVELIKLGKLKSDQKFFAK